MSDPFLGEIRMVGFKFAPNGWALCQGQLMAISQNSALFALLGTTYGGNGVNNFQLPDYRSRSPVGMGQGPGLSYIEQGEMSGVENVTLLQTQMPMHTHTAAAGSPGAVSATGQVAIPASTAGTTQATPATNTVLGPIAAGGRPGSLYSTTASDTTLAPFSITVSGTAAASAPTIGTAGGSLPLEIRNPYLGTNFIISLQGIYPSQG